MRLKKNKIGILGGSFDPAHRGHLAISKKAIQKFKLKQVIWAITKKNPLKKKSNTSLSERIKSCKKIAKKSNYIKIKFYEKIIKSNKTINLINYLTKKFNYPELFFIMGADNLISFHKWNKWKLILQKCNILVFDRQGYKSRSMESIAFKQFNRKKIDFIKFKKVNISSSKLRKI